MARRTTRRRCGSVGPATRRSARSTTGRARSPPSRIGFAALALGDVGEAQRTFRDALHGTLAALKLVTGALTAFLGLMLMRGEFVPGLSALDSSAQILSWAIVFGYAQQVFTRFVDQQAHNVLENVGGRGAAGDRPMARETA